jgi:hypothetical protein
MSVEGISVATALPFVALLSHATLSHLSENLGGLDDPESLPSMQLECIAERFGLERFAVAVASASLADPALAPTLEPRNPPRHPLGVLIPSMSLLKTELLPAHFSRRIYNAFRRSGVQDWPKLASLSLGNVNELRNVGVTSVTEVFAACIQFGIEALLKYREVPPAVAASDDPVPVDDGSKLLRAAESGDQKVPEQANSTVLLQSADLAIIDDLKLIAAWAGQERHSASLIEALSELSAVPEELPELVKGAVARLSKVETRSFGARHTRPFDVDAAADECLNRVCDAFDLLFPRELALANRLTLGELGERRGISRERVRQIELERVTMLKRSIRTSDNEVLQRSAQRLGDTLGDAYPVDAADELHPDLLSNEEQELRDPALRRLRLLLWLAGPYCLANGWLVRGDIQHVVLRTTAALDRMTGDGPVPVIDAIHAVSEAGVAEKFASRWLAELDGFRVQDDELVRWRGTLLDKAEMVLQLRGAPMSAEDIAGEIGNTSSARGLSYRLYEDARFMRSGVRHIALRRWGLEEYVGVQDAMQREIEHQGGEATVNHLVSVLTEKFQVAEASVRMYAAQNLLFVRTSRGTVRLRRDDDPVPEAPRIELSRRCFKLGEDWAYRVTVSSDTMRGSGTGTAPGFVAYAGVEGLESVTLPSSSGPVTIGRAATQNWIGSLRQAALDLGADIGDYLFVALPDGERVRYELVRASELLNTNPAERLAREVGTRLDLWDGDVVAAVSHAIGLEGGADKPTLRDVSLRLHARGEDDLASLLHQSQMPEHYCQSTLDSIANVLRSAEINSPGVMDSPESAVASR